MSHSSVALGRSVGTFTADNCGLASYSLKIDVPPGRGFGNEPDLSFEYSQGVPNGILGVGWGLGGGMSAIRLGPAVLAWDGVNNGPSDFSRTPKLNLDGTLLLNILGEYGASNAQYKTEIDNLGRTVSVKGQGFLVVDSTGQQLEYGTTSDSQSLASDGATVWEWRLKQQIDPFGNCITFTYEAPTPNKDYSGDNAPYLTTIAYSSNANAGTAALRLVTFEYNQRVDTLVQSVYGQRIVTTNILAGVHVSLVSNPEKTRIRSYQLSYTCSPSSGQSHLMSITECGYIDGHIYALDPTTFTYGGFPAEKQVFQQNPANTADLEGATNTILLMNLDISGRAMADIACFCHDPPTGQLSVKTFLASQQDTKIGQGPGISWSASNGKGATANLPPMNSKNENLLDKILGADLNGNGRIDLVIPYQGENNMTQISISESLATGFKDYTSVSTSLPWAADSAFQAVDFTGQGNHSVVQAFSKNGNLSLRIYPSITHDSELSLDSGDELDTEHKYANTIDWLSIPTQKTGAKVLVRVWEKDAGNGLFQLCATPYSLQDAQQPSNGFMEMSTSALGTVAEHSKGTLSVVSCDINADGVYDIVTCKVETPGSDIAFKFTTFLGDGLGGFQQLGDTVGHKYPYSPALSPGAWSATNLSGSQIPELVYTYQEAGSRGIVCFIAQGSSSGLVQADSMKFTRIANSLPSGQVQYSPADLNGTGISDYFIYTINSGLPTIIPSYNLDDITHALTTITSPLGLQTAITYVSLTDTTVYEPVIVWNATPTTNPSAYDIVAAPTLVVSMITNKNSESINGIPFKSSQTKVYKGAKTSRLGRGWQGFSNIVTTNTFQDNSSFVVDEAFEQDFPLTGLKTRIETSAPGGPVLKSQSLSYSQNSQNMNTWNIFRTDRTSEQTDTLDGAEVTRSIGTQYTKDKEGNVLERRDFEVQHGQLVNQSWIRFAYTTINGISGLQTCNKFTSNESNTDLTKYEEGDLSFTLYEYDAQRGLLLKASEWSTDTDSFSSAQYAYDEYGNEISSVEASGLTISTTYDSTFQTFPIQVAQTGKGFSHTRYTAYDELTGLKAVSRDEKGLISCFSYDAFGRCIASKLRNVDGQASPQSATDFLGNRPLLMDTVLLNELKDCMLDPSNSLQFQQMSSSSGSKYLCILSTMQYNGSSTGQTQVLEALNCLGLVCRQRTQQGQMTASWKYWNSNHEGVPTMESFPLFLPSTVQTSAELDYVPDPSTCVQTTFDALGRPTQTTRPSHSDAGVCIAVGFSYQDGGATVVEQRFKVSSQTSESSQISLSTSTKKFRRLAGKDYVTAKTDENGLTTMYTYDSAGRLIMCQDPAGNVEARTYNSRGQIITMNNPSQNTQSDPGTLAITRVYDVAGYLLSETNVLGETQSFQADASGRPLKKAGSDGRSIVYSYDQNGLRSLSSVTIFSSSSTKTPESQFLFEYDSRGRASKKTVILTNGDTYSTEFQYDWQNQVVNTQLPDGSQIPKAWQGSSMVSTAINGPSSESWDISAEFSNYSSFERAGSCSISGTGFVKNFTHDYTWDTQGFASAHAMSGAATLIQNSYSYNDDDQLQSIQESVSGQQTSYTYSGKRLASSTIGSQPTYVYTYDDSGNMTTRGDTTIAYGASSASGTRNGTPVFQIDYDAAGRMTGRKTLDQALTFAYDGLGHMSTISKTGAGEETRLINDFSGHTLQRLKSDGSQEIFINRNYTVIIKSNGQRSVRYALFNHQELLASATVEVPAGSLVSSSNPTIQVHYCDTKSNVTHGYNPTNGTLVNQVQYDDYGFVTSPNTISSSTESCVNTYESKSLIDFGLLDFGARWYDPLVGRFASPDDITDLALLFCPDGTNRYAFENNDPINHVDPSGHFSWNAFWGGVVSGAMIVAGIGLMFASFGGSAAISSGLISGGIAGMSYSINHANEKNGTKFWGHLGITVAVNFVIGAATDGLGAAMRVSKLGEWACDTAKSTKLATALRVGGKGLAGGVSSVADDAGDRELDNLAFNEHKDIWSGAGSDFAEGVGLGLLGAGKDELKDHLQAKYGDRVADSLKGELEWRRAGDGFLSKHGSEGFWKKVFSGIEKLRPPVPQWKIPTANSSMRVWTNPFTK
ncbi:uncharacterized protein FFB14_06119 [Fusarium fujikuroi]|nr:uncharacterized protein FFB14_06119 [Fusarium fujikuroi]